ncbi:MAG: ATPase [Deltaproteobacteria bacterium]|nr:MAG: ATPase [Deltaproteobacteria bacterium]
MSQSVLRIGRVIEVNGSRTIGELEASVDDLYRTYKSRKYTIGQVGSIVKIESGDLLIFGIVISLRMEETDSTQANTAGRTESSAKWIEIELFGQGHKTGLGEAEFHFERGISTYPLPGQAIYLATVEELRRIYAKPDKPTIKVGSVAQARGLPVHLLTNELLGKHFAILGTTGSGKSCAVALLIHSIIEEYPHSHIILLDPHNEYYRAFPEKAEIIDPTSLEIPHWLLTLEESIELFIGRTEHAATRQTNILKDAILQARKGFPDQAVPTEKITVDTPVSYKLGDLVHNIEQAKAGLSASKAESHEKILSKIRTLLEDKRFEFLLRPNDDVSDNLAELLAKLFRIPDQEKPLTIIDLSGVPSDVVDVVVSVLCRTIFDFALWNPKRSDIPLFLVCEEAHRYAPRSEEASFQPTKRALARIAKEGRKYGVGLALVTQRPSELSESILSQCNTIIALRMSNEQDQHFVRRALPDSVRSLVDALPALRTREALVVGEGTAVPVRMLFNEIPEDRQPHSADVPYAEAWQKEFGNEEMVKDVVKRWREQRR